MVNPINTQNSSSLKLIEKVESTPSEVINCFKTQLKEIEDNIKVNKTMPFRRIQKICDLEQELSNFKVFLTSEAAFSYFSDHEKESDELNDKVAKTDRYLSKRLQKSLSTIEELLKSSDISKIDLSYIEIPRLQKKLSSLKAIVNDPDMKNQIDVIIQKIDSCKEQILDLELVNKISAEQKEKFLSLSDSSKKIVRHVFEKTLGFDMSVIKNINLLHKLESSSNIILKDQLNLLLQYELVDACESLWELASKNEIEKAEKIIDLFHNTLNNENINVKFKDIIIKEQLIVINKLLKELESSQSTSLKNSFSDYMEVIGGLDISILTNITQRDSVLASLDFAIAHREILDELNHHNFLINNLSFETLQLCLATQKKLNIQFENFIFELSFNSLEKKLDPQKIISFIRNLESLTPEQATTKLKILCTLVMRFSDYPHIVNSLMELPHDQFDQLPPTLISLNKSTKPNFKEIEEIFNSHQQQELFNKIFNPFSNPQKCQNFADKVDQVPGAEPPFKNLLNRVSQLGDASSLNLFPVETQLFLYSQLLPLATTNPVLFNNCLKLLAKGVEVGQLQTLLKSISLHPENVERLLQLIDQNPQSLPAIIGDTSDKLCELLDQMSDQEFLYLTHPNRDLLVQLFLITLENTPTIFHELIQAQCNLTPNIKDSFDQNIKESLLAFFYFDNQPADWMGNQLESNTELANHLHANLPLIKEHASDTMPGIKFLLEQNESKLLDDLLSLLSSEEISLAIKLFDMVKAGYIPEVKQILELKNNSTSSPQTKLLLTLVGSENGQEIKAILGIYSDPQRWKVLIDHMETHSGPFTALLNKLLFLYNEEQFSDLEKYLRILSKSGDQLTPLEGYVKKRMEHGAFVNFAFLESIPERYQKELFSLEPAITTRLLEAYQAELKETHSHEEAFNSINSFFDIDLFTINKLISLQKFGVLKYSPKERIQNILDAISPESFSSTLEYEQALETAFTIEVTKMILTESGRVNLVRLGDLLNLPFVKNHGDNNEVYHHLKNIHKILSDHPELMDLLAQAAKPDQEMAPSSDIIRKTLHLSDDEPITDRDVQLTLLSAILSRPRQETNLGSCFGTQSEIILHTNAEGLQLYIEDCTQMLKSNYLERKMLKSENHTLRYPITITKTRLNEPTLTRNPLLEAHENTIANMAGATTAILQKNLALFSDRSVGFQELKVRLEQLRLNNTKQDRQVIFEEFRSQFLKNANTKFFIDVENPQGFNGVWNLVDLETQEPIHTIDAYKNLYNRVLDETEKALSEKFKNQPELLESSIKILKELVAEESLFHSSDQSRSSIKELFFGDVGGHDYEVVRVHQQIEAKTITYSHFFLSDHQYFSNAIHFFASLPQKIKDEFQNNPEKRIPGRIPMHAMCFKFHALAQKLSNYDKPLRNNADIADFIDHCLPENSVEISPEEKNRLIDYFIEYVPEINEPNLIQQLHEAKTVQEFGRLLNNHLSKNGTKTIPQQQKTFVEEMIFKELYPHNKQKLTCLIVGDLNYNNNAHSNAYLAFSRSILDGNVVAFNVDRSGFDRVPYPLKNDKDPSTQFIHPPMRKHQGRYTTV